MTIEAVSTPSQELIDAIHRTIDFRDGRWTGARIGEALKARILVRSGAMRTHIEHAVRLAVVLDACDPLGHMHLMYVRLKDVRFESIRRMIVAAGEAGRLHGVCIVGGKKIVFPADGPLSRGRKDFDIEFGQMPLALAALSFLHNSIGYGGEATVAATIDALRRGSHPGSAEDAARTLRRMLKDWLKERMDGQYPVRQALVLRGFLFGLSKAKVDFHAGTLGEEAAERITINFKHEHVGTYDVGEWHRRTWDLEYRSFQGGVPVPTLARGLDVRHSDLIDDESILLFWSFAARSRRIDLGQIGMKKFRSAAGAFMDYRQALLLSDVKTAASRAVSLVTAEGREVAIYDGRSSVARSRTWRNDNDEFDSDESHDAGDDGWSRETDPRALRAVDGDAEEWCSPFVYFANYKKLQVNWLTETNFELLLMAVGGRGHKDALFGGARPVRTYALTLARHICFGDVQDSLIQNVPWERSWPKDDPYERLRTKIKWLDRVTRDLVYATANALFLRNEHVRALSLLLSIEPDLVAQTIGTQDADAHATMAERARLMKRVADMVRAKACPAGVRMSRGAAATARAGFRKDDERDDRYEEDLVEGSQHVFALHREVERIADWFDGLAQDAFERDARRFRATLAEMYGQGG